MFIRQSSIRTSIIRYNHLITYLHNNYNNVSLLNFVESCIYIIIILLIPNIDGAKVPFLFIYIIVYYIIHFTVLQVYTLQ